MTAYTPEMAERLEALADNLRLGAADLESEIMRCSTEPNNDFYRQQVITRRSWANDLAATIDHITAQSVLLQTAKEEMARSAQEAGALVAKVTAYQLSFHEIEQTLGKALGYPWFKDDRKNFPGAVEADGVCTGEHTPESMAEEAATEITTHRAQVEALARKAVRRPLAPPTPAEGRGG